jgi:hypothetical protein
MPDNKQQHFVPRFYLAYFSHNEGRSIGVFNLKRRLAVRNASVRDQACKPYYYGKDLRAERNLGTIEGQAANVLNQIRATDRVPTRYSAEHHTLVYFLAVQLARTTAAEAEMNEQTTKFAKALLTRTITDPKLAKHLPNLKVTRHIMESVRDAMLVAPTLYDLKYKLIVNVSTCAFVASDTPVVLHNQFLSNGLVGFGSAGLQIFLPLGPWRAILLYDEHAYDVGEKTSNVVRLVNCAHASLLNELQWESAYENLYFSKQTQEADLLEIAERLMPVRRNEAVEFRESAPHQVDERRSLIFFHMKRPQSNVDLSLSFIKLRRTPPKDAAHNFASTVRNPDWTAYVKAASDAVQKGALSVAEFRSMTSKVPVLAKRSGNK